MDIAARLKALGYDKRGSFCKGFVQGIKDFGSAGGHTVFTILLDTTIGDKLANVRNFPNRTDLENWQSNLTVEEMELALEIIYCYREWRQDCPKCMHFNNEDFKCTSCMKGE